VRRQLRNYKLEKERKDLELEEHRVIEEHKAIGRLAKKGKQHWGLTIQASAKMGKLSNSWIERATSFLLAEKKCLSRVFIIFSCRRKKMN
jgi:hypothetical protein